MPHLATLLAAAAHGAAGRGHAATTAQTVSAPSLLVQMVIGLAVVIALIKVASRLLQARGGRLPGQGRRQGAVAVVGRQSLGKGVQVAMVTAADQTYLVGITQHQVTMLGELTPGRGTLEGAGGELGELQLVRGEHQPEPTVEEVAGWKSAIEQMRTKTVRRA